MADIQTAINTYKLQKIDCTVWEKNILTIKAFQKYQGLSWASCGFEQKLNNFLPEL